MRTSSLITVSLPPPLLRDAERLARVRFMSRSELVRDSLRRTLDEARAENAVRLYEREKMSGKLRVLKGSLVNLMS